MRIAIDPKPRTMLKTSDKTFALDHLQSLRERLTHHVEFIHVATEHVRKEIIIAFREGPLGREESFHGDIRLAAILQRDPAFDEVVVFVDAVMQSQM